MKFLCLCYYDTAAFATLAPEDAEALGPQCRPHDEALRTTGKVDAVGSFAMPDRWRTIRPADGGPQTSDGPISTATQQAGAFLIVDAADADEAVAVASKHAAANIGRHLGFAVEVRPCEHYE